MRRHERHRNPRLERVPDAMSRQDAAIWVDPGRCGGTPCITGTRITTEAITGLVWSHGPQVALDCWPHITEADVKAAVWYEVTHGNRRKWRKRFGDWASEWSEQMWSGRWAEVPTPNGAERQT